MTLIQNFSKLQFRDWLGLWSHVWFMWGGYYFRLTCVVVSRIQLTPVAWAEGLIFLVHVCWWAPRCLPGAPPQREPHNMSLDLPQSREHKPRWSTVKRDICYFATFSSLKLDTSYSPHQMGGCKRLRKLGGEKQRPPQKQQNM